MITKKIKAGLIIWTSCPAVKKFEVIRVDKDNHCHSVYLAHLKGSCSELIYHGHDILINHTEFHDSEVNAHLKAISNLERKLKHQRLDLIAADIKPKRQRKNDK